MSQKSKFIAYVDQTSFGCKYTIGCGKVLWELKARTRDEAEKEVREKVLGDEEEYHEGYYDESKIDNSVIIYEIASEMVVPINEWYLEKESEIAIAERKEDKHFRREQYELLKKEFENEPS